MKVTFIGLGVMGYPMAGHLAQSGHQVRVFNRTHSKAQAWAEQYDGQACDTVADAVQGSEIVFLCVGDDADVRERVAQVIDAAAPARSSLITPPPVRRSLVIWIKPVRRPA